MSIWSDSPEFFDTWLETHAANGRFGPEAQAEALNGDFDPGKWWDKLDKAGKLASEAELAYIERFID